MALVVLAVLLAAAVGWWAARATLPPRVEIASAPTPETAKVTQVSVGRSLDLGASAQRTEMLLARNGASGLVTRADRGVRTVDAGSVLYAVDERPVAAAAGDVPFYRDLGLGAQGRDVAQLNVMLQAVRAPGAPGGDRFTAATARAVRGWQKTLGVEQSGTVARSDLVALPTLPASVALRDPITVGAQVGGGEEALASVSDAPTFEMVLAPNQTSLVPLGADVVVTAGGQQLAAHMGDGVQGSDGDLHVPLTGRDGAVLCDAACAASIPPGEPVTLPAKVVVVPDAKGPGVPVAALTTDAQGGVSVTLADGSRKDVTVVASSGGVAVLDGLDVGQRVRLRSLAPAGS